MTPHLVASPVGHQQSVLRGTEPAGLGERAIAPEVGARVVVEGGHATPAAVRHGPQGAAGDVADAFRERHAQAAAAQLIRAQPSPDLQGLFIHHGALSATPERKARWQLFQARLAHDMPSNKADPSASSQSCAPFYCKGIEKSSRHVFPGEVAWYSRRLGRHRGP